MNLHSPTLNSDIIYDSYGGGFWGQVTRLALKLDVFSPLSVGPSKADLVAKKCGASVEGTRSILNYLASTSLLMYQESEKTYSLTPEAAAFLVQGEKTYAGDWIMMNTDPILWEKVLSTIQSGKSAGYQLPWDQDAWIESFSPSRVEFSLNMWQSIGIDLGLNHPFNILDLASGCGIKSMAFAQANENVRVTCLDMEPVLKVARDLAGRLNVEFQTTFMPEDLLSADLGISQYDAGLLGLITYILTPEQNIELFKRCHKALKPGGQLLIDAIMAVEEPKEWASRVSLLMYTWNGGAAHSFTSYETWLEQAGFRQVNFHNEQLVSAVK